MAWCANERSVVWKATNAACGAGPVVAVSPCGGACRGGDSNGTRQYQVCSRTSEGINITVCADEKSDIFNSTNATCGACPVIPVSPCAEPYLCGDSIVTHTY